jgi:hypothetical protein
MESLTISYCFFTPKSLHKELRFWDVYNTQERYWYNIPALICVNSIVYPDARIKIHLSNEIRENPLFEILQRIVDVFKNVELVFMPYEYENTEPTMWRYKPLFDKESDILLCRDIDSLPNTDEIKSTMFFLKNNQFFTHTLRTHTNHVSPQTIMLAGLCGFRPNKIEFLNNVNFEMYYNHFKNSGWGLDQNSLINMFVRDQNWTKQRFLDSPISTEFHKVGPPIIECQSLNQDVYRNTIDLDLPKELTQILDSETKWAGEPTNFRGEKLKNILKIDLPQTKLMSEVIDGCSEEIKNFYLGDV